MYIVYLPERWLKDYFTPREFDQKFSLRSPPTVSRNLPFVLHCGILHTRSSEVLRKSYVLEKSGTSPFNLREVFREVLGTSRKSLGSLQKALGTSGGPRKVCRECPSDTRKVLGKSWELPGSFQGSNEGFRVPSSRNFWSLLRSLWKSSGKCKGMSWGF